MELGTSLLGALTKIGGGDDALTNESDTCKLERTIVHRQE